VAGKMIAGLQVGLGLDSAEFKKGADEAKKKAQELGQSLASNSTQTKGYSSAINDAAAAQKNFQYNLRNVGYQVQDFSVQVSAGTSATQALAQQLPQLLSGFGTMGVVLGTIAAVGIPVAIAAFNILNGNIKSLEDATKDATSAANDFIAANNKAGQSLTGIAESYHKDAAPALKELYDQLKAIAKIELDLQMKKFTQSLINEYAPTWKLALPEIFNLFRDSPVEKLSKDLGVSNDEAKQLFKTLREFQEGKKTFEELTSFVSTLSLQTREATEEGQKLRRQLLETITKITEANTAKTETQKKEEGEAKRLAESEAKRRQEYLDGLDQQIRRLKEGENAALLFEAAKQGGAEGVKKAKQIIDLKKEEEDLKNSLKKRIKEEERQLKEEEEATKAFRKAMDDDSKRAIYALEKQEEAERKAAEAGEKRYQQFRKELDAARTPLEVYRDKVDEINRAFSEGLITSQEHEKILRKYSEDLQKKYDPLIDILDDLRDGFKSLGGSIVDAFTSGKSAMDTFKTVLLDIFKRMATKQFNQLFDLMMPKAGGGMLNRLIGSITGAFTGGGFGTGSSFGNMDIGGFLAEGGPVQGNEAYIVGEKGPELFVPNASGTIVPNNMIMGSGQTVNYNGPYIANMQAIDTQSGLQFLMQNKQTIWAANQSAQRSLPVSK